MKLFFIEHMKEMEINPFNLSFGGFREKRFLHYYRSIALRDARLAWYVGILIYALFGVHDLIFIPQHKTTLWILRYLIVSPLMLGILFASYHKLASRYTQILISMAILICGFGIVYSLVLVPAKE